MAMLLCALLWTSVLMKDPSSQIGSNWTIGDAGTLFWQGAPYVPMGVQCSPDQIPQAPSAADLLVTATPEPAGWPWVETLERRGKPYLLEFGSPGPAAVGFTVEPQSYRRDAPTGSLELNCRLPGAERVLAVLAEKRDASVLWHRIVEPDADGEFRIRAEARGRVDAVLLLYPVGESRATVDFWEGFDAHRDAVLSTLRRSRIGGTLRAVLNPLGRNPSYPGPETQFVPTSTLFRMELERHLRDTYKNFVTAQRAWGLGASELEGFEDLASLVPLWSGKRGLQAFWDSKRQRFWGASTGSSRAWLDIRAVMRQAAMRRSSSLFQAVKSLTGVPVLQEFTQDADLFQARPIGLDGLCAASEGATIGQQARSVASAAAAALSWRPSGWTIVSRLQWTGVPEELPAVVQELEALGIRGAFVPLSMLRKPEVLLAPSFNLGVAATSPKVLGFPVAAFEPAQVQRLASGWVWLPTSAAGRRLDFGPEYRGYFQDAGSPTTVLWRIRGTERVRLRHPSAKELVFETLDGSDPRPRVVKGGVEVTVGELPLVVKGGSEPPVPEPAIAWTVARFEGLIKQAEALKRAAPSEVFGFRQALAALEKSPWPSYAAMRERFWRLNLLLGSFTWMEAESARSMAAGEVIASPGASGDTALRLQVPARLSQEPIVVEYSLPVRSNADQELWVAARLPGNQARNVSLVLQGQRWQLAGQPLSAYGQGFAWYRVGVTRLQTGYAELKLEILPEEGLDLGFDAFLLAPVGVRPDGPWMPLTPIP
ncbi:MAG: hypothetical protein N2109_01515 [Fimbriimonadales bacterium]|nr:hypothetical protein [Fimbriimonadales bacterium]